MSITSSGGRLHALNQAARDRQIAIALRYSLEHYEYPPEVVRQCRERIAAHDTQAAALEESVAADDDRTKADLPAQLRNRGQV